MHSAELALRTDGIDTGAYRRARLEPSRAVERSGVEEIRDVVARAVFGPQWRASGSRGSWESGARRHDEITLGNLLSKTVLYFIEHSAYGPTIR